MIKATDVKNLHDNLKQTHGVHLLRFTGSVLERATQHGQVLANLDPEFKQRLPLQSLSLKNQTLIARALFPHSALAKKVFSGIYETLIQNRAKQLPVEYRNLIQALLKDTGIPEEQFWLSLYQPDFLMVLAAISTQKVQGRLFEGFPGCTAGAFLPANDSRAYFLRNLDYPLASYWERVPAVSYHEPSDSQKYINISALGVHTAGLTAYNESGITFSLNAHFSKKISLAGTPIFFLGDEVIREAKTLDDAIRICKKFKTIGSWMLLVASFQERKAVSIELSDGKVFIREMNPAQDGGRISHSNAFFCPEFQAETLHFSGAVREDSDLRKQEMDERLQKAFQHKNESAREILLALGDHLDLSTGETRLFGNTISVVTTVQSSVMSPNENSFYLSARHETPTGLGPYLKLPFAWGDIDEAVLNQTPLEFPLNYPDDFKAALHEYHLAYVLWHVEHVSPVKVLKHLQAATEILPRDAHLQMQRGYFELMGGSPELALNCFSDALNEAKCGKLSPNTRAVANYFLAVCMDLATPPTRPTGAPLTFNARSVSAWREKAREHYQRAIQDPNADLKLKKKAQKRLKKRFTEAERVKILPDMQFVEPLEYP